MNDLRCIHIGRLQEVFTIQFFRILIVATELFCKRTFGQAMSVILRRPIVSVFQIIVRNLEILLSFISIFYFSIILTGGPKAQKHKILKSECYVKIRLIIGEHKTTLEQVHRIINRNIDNNMKWK